MKKGLWLTVIVLFSVFVTYAQKQNGKVFIEHPEIEKTTKLWQAIVDGDKEAYVTLFSDSAIFIYNGSRDFEKLEEHIDGFGWLSEEFQNLKVVDDTPAYPDAIEYDSGGTWVQDWKRMTGIHTKTGIRLDLPIHSLFSFNADGKITSFHRYFNNDVFQDITDSQTTKENGKVYINHPYIAIVRKLVNAYCAENVESMLSYYSSDVRFVDSTMKMGESKKIDTAKEELNERFAMLDDIDMKQTGYPDCIYYALNDSYTVYSWWIHSATVASTGEKHVFPVMLSHSFDKEGKIVGEMSYFSTNHLEEK